MKPGPKPKNPDRGEAAHANKKRPARVPMSAGNKLKIPDHLLKEGYQHYWSIYGPDHPGKLQQMEAAYWEYVLDEEGNKLEQPAGKGNTHVAMRLPMEYYREDMAAQQKRNIDATQSNVQALGDSEYVPKGQSKVVERDLI
jgi:hypothetical protein